MDDGDGEEDAYGNDDDKRYNLSSNRNDEFARYFLELSLIAPVHRNDSSQRYLDRSKPPQFCRFCRDLGTTTMLQFSLVESGNESMHRLPISII